MGGRGAGTDHEGSQGRGLGSSGRVLEVGVCVRESERKREDPLYIFQGQLWLLWRTHKAELGKQVSSEESVALVQENTMVS